MLVACLATWECLLQVCFYGFTLFISMTVCSGSNHLPAGSHHFGLEGTLYSNWMHWRENRCLREVQGWGELRGEVWNLRIDRNPSAWVYKSMQSWFLLSLRYNLLTKKIGPIHKKMQMISLLTFYQSLQKREIVLMSQMMQSRSLPDKKTIFKKKNKEKTDPDGQEGSKSYLRHLRPSL